MMFSCKYYEIFKNTFFLQNNSCTASVYLVPVYRKRDRMDCTNFRSEKPANVELSI